MTWLTPLGRTFFALALIGLGVEHFLFGEFVTGRAPAWPATAPGGFAWAALTGAAFVATGIAVLFGRWARMALICAAALILVWALFRNLPVAAADSLLGAAWTRAGKAMTLVGGALATAGTLPVVVAGGERSSLVRFVNVRDGFLHAGRVSLALFLVLTGIQHFLFTAFVASLIPSWFPGDAVGWTYFAGIALIAGGVGLSLPRTAPLAAGLSGAMVFSWFWIVHLPRTFADVSDGIAVFEALAVAGIAFLLAGSLGETGEEARAGEGSREASSGSGRRGSELRLP